MCVMKETEQTRSLKEFYTEGRLVVLLTKMGKNSGVMSLGEMGVNYFDLGMVSVIYFLSIHRDSHGR